MLTRIPSYLCLFFTVLRCSSALVWNTRNPPLKPIVPGEVTTFRGCFTPDCDLFPREKEWVRQVTADTWGRVASVEFLYQPICDATLDFNITFGNFSRSSSRIWKPRNKTIAIKLRSLVGTYPERKREMVIKRNAVHEFGHLLGFMHEGQRWDAPISCQMETSRNDGGGVDERYTRLTAYNDYSVMQYCDVVINSSYISSLDIEGIRTVYGKREKTRKMKTSTLLATAASVIMAATVAETNPVSRMCTPEGGFCNYTTCYVNDSAVYICPECCEDMVCSGPPTFIRDIRECRRRSPSFSKICQAVSWALMKLPSRNINNSSDMVTQYVLTNMFKNCTVSAHGEPTFEEACQVVEHTIFSFPIYSSLFELYNANGGQCGFGVDD